LVRSLFVPVDAEAILRIKPSRRLDYDVLAWQPEPSGIFTVRSAYKLGLADLTEQCNIAASSSGGNDPSWAMIWCSSVPPKVIIFAWRAASNGLATEENKRHRGMRVTGVCNICGARPESVAHALAECPHARRLWERMRMVWSLPCALELVGSPLVSSCYLKPFGSPGGYYPTSCLARMVYTQRSHP
jgi:hypothetical protein